MKLLDKKEINASKALERRLEVEEGRKLAARVDGLRELSAREEASLSAFKNAAIEATKAEIQVFIDKRMLAESDAKEAEHVREVSLRPVNLKEKELAEREDSVKALEQALSEKKAMHAEIEREAAERLLRAKTKESEALMHLDNARTFRVQAAFDRQEASRLAQEAKNGMMNLDIFIKEKEDELLSWEADVSGRDIDVRNKYTHIAAETARLSLRERAIIDREEQLAREIIRQAKIS